MKYLAVFLCAITLVSCTHRQLQTLPEAIPRVDWQPDKSWQSGEKSFRCVYDNNRISVSQESSTTRQRIMIFSSPASHDSISECLSVETINGKITRWYFKKWVRIKLSTARLIESRLYEVEAKWKKSYLSQILTEPFMRTIPDKQIMESAIRAKLYADSR